MRSWDGQLLGELPSTISPRSAEVEVEQVAELAGASDREVLVAVVHQHVGLARLGGERLDLAAPTPASSSFG